MLSTEELIKLYLVLNKLMYAHSQLGIVIFNKQRNPDVDNEDFIKLQEMSLIIDMLLEANDSLILEGKAYPFYGIIESLELDKMLDFIIYTYNLDPVPYLDFPKNSTSYIGQTVSIENTSNGTELPIGGGVGFYLSKNLSGQLIWKELDTVTSDFNLI